MSDEQTEKRLRQGGGRAFHSRLEPFVEFIRSQRHRRKTWQEIAAQLRTEKGCPITFQGVYQFYRRYLKRQARPHWERDGARAIPSPESVRKPMLGSLPPARPRSFSAPSPESIQINDLTK